MKPTYYLLSLSLVGASACGDDEPTSEPDATSDTSTDVVEDTAPDVVEDTAPDVGVDATPDIGADATPDIEPDAVDDTESDVADDGGSDTDNVDVVEDTGPIEPTGPLIAFHAVHLAEGAGPLDVLTTVVSTPFHSELPFGESTGIVSGVGGDADVVFRTADDSYEASIGTEFGFGGDDQFTVGAIGAAGSPLAVILREDASPPPGGGVRYRYVHATSSLSASVNLWFANDGEPDDTFIEDLEFGTISDDAVRAEGPHRISIDLEKDGTPDVFFDIGNLSAASQYTFWISNDDVGPFILSTDNTGGSSRIDGSVIE